MIWAYSWRDMTYLFLLSQQINNSYVFTPDTEEREEPCKHTHRKLKSSPRCSSSRTTSGFGWENRQNVKERERERGKGRQEKEGEKGRVITWRAYSLFQWHSHVAPLWEDNLSLLQSQSAIHTITYNINQSVPSNGFWRADPLYGLKSNPRPLMHLLTLL